jgi:U11/U12 small nuclear ribonucleoprotein SNRNP35
MEKWSPYLDKVYCPLLAGSIDGTDDQPHDRAICRALEAKYKPSKLVQGDPNLTLFVARLSPNTDEDTIYSAFRQFGKIRHARLVRDIVTGFSKCYGFVEFESEKSLRQALSREQFTIDDKEVLLDTERSRTLKNWVPRRLGGGFGGKKESGQLRFGGVDRPFRKPIMASRSSISGVGEENQHIANTSGSSREPSDSRRKDYSGRYNRNVYSSSSRESTSSSRYDNRKNRNRSRSPFSRERYSTR